MKINAIQQKATFLAIASMFLSLSFSCKKEKESSDPLTLLTSKAWKPVEKDGNPSTNPKTDYFYFAAPPCLLDNTHLYARDGKKRTNNGKTLCDFGEAETYTTDYTVDFSKNQLTESGNNMTILELTSTRLKLAVPLTQTQTGILLFEH